MLASAPTPTETATSSAVARLSLDEKVADHHHSDHRQHCRAAEAGEVAKGNLQPFRTDGLGRIARHAQRQQQALVEDSGLALNDLVGEAHEGRGRTGEHGDGGEGGELGAGPVAETAERRGETHAP